MLKTNDSGPPLARSTSTRRFSVIGLALAFGGFAYGLVHLFQLRFEAGDNYPAYSTLRADPLGGKALFESLRLLTHTERRFRSLSRLEEGSDQTLFLLGVEAVDPAFAAAEFGGLEAFVRSGGRLVISLLPEYQQPRLSRFPPAGRPSAPPGVGPTNAVPPGADPSETARPVRLGEQWGFAVGHAPLTLDARGKRLAMPAARRQLDSALPPELATHTAVLFQGLNPAWRVGYARPNPTNDLPVLIERSLGRGTIVLWADSYPFSNEALRQDPQESLLVWAVGANHRVLFDETHLGVRVEPGIAALARQYHLGFFGLCLLILALLFVWKNATSFLPPLEEHAVQERGDQVEGRDSASGFINLLRRHLPASALMKTCLEQWNAHSGSRSRPSPARLQAMQKRIDQENARAAAQQDPIALYRDFCQILARRRGDTEPHLVRGPHEPSHIVNSPLP